MRLVELEVVFPNGLEALSKHDRSVASSVPSVLDLQSLIRDDEIPALFSQTVLLMQRSHPYGCCQAAR